MRRDAIIAVAGAAVIVLASVGLATGALREGPLEGAVQPVTVPVAVSGSYHAVGPSDVNGLCLQPPCEARTEIELTFAGLPAGAYDVYLEAPDTRHGVGALDRSDSGHTFRYVANEDHRDKEGLVVMWGSTEVLVVPVRDTAEPLTIDTTVEAGLDTPAGTYFATEIGGVSVSTVVDIWFPGEPPPERRYHAWFMGTAGPVDLGVLESNDDGSRLDARVERLRLEDQDRLTVYVETDHEGSPSGSGPVGLPVLSADL